MKKLFSMKLDATDYSMDSDFDKIASTTEDLSDKVKTAHIPSYEEAETIPNKYFALILKHPSLGTLTKFAHNSSEITELNMAFLSSEINNLPEELVKIAASNLTCAAKNFNLEIPDNLQPYESKKYIPNSLNIQAINEKDFVEKLAKLKKGEGIDKIAYALNNKYPIHTTGHIKTASSWFDRNYSKLTIDEQKEFIENISNQAEKLNFKLEKVAKDFNNLDFNKFNEDLYNNIKVRKTYVPDDMEETKEVFDDLLSRADEIGPEKTAYVLEIVDRELGLDKIYGHGLIDPLRACLGTIEKEASVIIEGKTITKIALNSLGNGDLTMIAGTDLVSELKGENALEVFESLPTPIKQEIAGLL